MHIRTTAASNNAGAQIHTSNTVMPVKTFTHLKARLHDKTSYTYNQLCLAQSINTSFAFLGLHKYPVKTGNSPLIRPSDVFHVPAHEIFAT